ncbi:MAG: hypothetical protein ACOY4F_09790 [Thermodesulfobacteriota bacterium]
MTLPIVAALGIVLGWYLVFNYESALRGGTSAAFAKTQLEIARALARGGEEFARAAIGTLSAQSIESEIRSRFVAPVRLLGGGAWLYSQGGFDCARDALLTWCPGECPEAGKAEGRGVVYRDEDASPGMERILAAVSAGREGTGVFFSRRANMQEVVAWTPLSVAGTPMVIGVSTGLPNILEASGVVRQSRNAMVMVGLMTVGGLGLIIVSAKNIVRRRQAEIELEQANAELEDRVARRTEELQAQTKALMESRMRERLREKEAEIAFQAGLVESAGTYLHTTGNALTALEGLFLKMRRTLEAMAGADGAFVAARAALAEALGREDSPAVQSLNELESALLGRAVPRLAETLTEMAELKTRMIAELEGRRGLFDARRPARRFAQAVDMGELLRELAQEARGELTGEGLGIEVQDAIRLEARVARRKVAYGLGRCLDMIQEAARPGHDGAIRLSAGRSEDGGIRVLLRAEGAAFVGADPCRDDPQLLTFINYLNENHGLFGIVHDAGGFSVEVELGNAPADEEDPAATS